MSEVQKPLRGVCVQTGFLAQRRQKEVWGVEVGGVFLFSGGGGGC